MSISLAILGGGPAGLAAGYTAAAAGLSCAILESASSVGGNCRTLSHGEFLYDTGAHRLHDRSTSSTAIFRELLGEELREVTAPSRIAFNGRFVNFPLSPLNVGAALGVGPSLIAAVEVLRTRLGSPESPRSFEDFASTAYGRTIAEAFLLGYSEKLWGRPCRDLSPAIAGARLRGLGVLAVLKELLPGRRRRAHHLDGTFLYPQGGIGRLTERLAEACGAGVIHVTARVTRVVHDGRRITSVVVNGHDRRDVEAVVSTLPLTSLVQMLDPSPPDAVLEAAGGLRWRHVLLAALFLRRPSVTPCATVYFPDPAVPFTRVYEPRNRSERMAPPGHTSLVAEVPFDEDSPEEMRDPHRVIAAVRRSLVKVGWLRESEIVGCQASQLPHAYPVLDLAAPARLSLIREYLASFENLRLAGRPGKFAYSHLHDQVEQGREAVLSLRGLLTATRPYRSAN